MHSRKTAHHASSRARGMAIRLLTLSAILGVVAAHAAETQPVDAATLSRIREASMSDDWAYRRLAELTDRIGPRISGSPQLAAALVQVADAMRSLGARVTLNPAKVPHWVRGDESAELVDYPDRPAGITQRLRLTALGGSGATPPKGLTARIVVVRDMAELHERAGEVRGSIVVFDEHFDQRLADNGLAGVAYRQAGAYRFRGPSVAAELGAAAALLRSVGGADYRLPHTGGTVFAKGQAAIPSAALAAEDADLIARLAARGPVSMALVLTPKTLPDADSANVIADWPGREKPDEYVIVSGHLDSWDLGTGATDDGVGAMAAAGVIAVLQRLDLHPRRSVRFVGWTSEENGGQGAKAYLASLGSAIDRHVAAIESDEGAGRALGVNAAVTLDSIPRLQPVIDALGPIGAVALQRHDGELGSDISLLQGTGVPGFSPLVDARHYFDYHHTAADTLDKVDPQNLRTQIATMAVLAYYLAELPEPLPRFKTPE
jgi:carboxypeptidase Q